GPSPDEAGGSDGSAGRPRPDGYIGPSVVAPFGDVRQTSPVAGVGAGGGSVLLGGVADVSLELGVDALGFGELVFQNDDAAGRLQRGALVDQVAGALGQA